MHRHRMLPHRCHWRATESGRRRCCRRSPRFPHRWLHSTDPPQPRRYPPPRPRSPPPWCWHRWQPSRSRVRCQGDRLLRHSHPPLWCHRRRPRCGSRWQGTVRHWRWIRYRWRCCRHRLPVHARPPRLSPLRWRWHRCPGPGCPRRWPVRCCPVPPRWCRLPAHRCRRRWRWRPAHWHHCRAQWHRCRSRWPHHLLPAHCHPPPVRRFHHRHCHWPGTACWSSPQRRLRHRAGSC